MEHIGLAQHDVLALKQYVALQRAYADRISLALVLELLTRNLDTTAVFQELDQPEGIGPKEGPGPETQFAIPPLTAFWHRDINVDACVTSNLGVRWQPNEQAGEKAEAQIVQRVKGRTRGSEGWNNEQDAGMACERHAGNALPPNPSTVSRIIYGKNNDMKYYLALVSPLELRTDTAEELFRSIKSGCYEEFPFLFKEGSASET